MESFRLLHLSDLHIARLQKVIGFPDLQYAPHYPLGYFSFSPSSYDFDLSKAVAKYAFLHGHRLDAILITGDLATAGNAADLNLAHDYVHAAGLQAPLPGQPVWTWAPWLTANGFPTLESSGALNDKGDILDILLPFAVVVETGAAANGSDGGDARTRWAPIRLHGATTSFF
jgi:3',5'-cyclic AMP phosphodiesterase CpdA